jgi:hypothetical protein
MIIDALVICFFGTWFFNISDTRKKKQKEGFNINQYLIIVVVLLAFVDLFLHFLKKS